MPTSVLRAIVLRRQPLRDNSQIVSTFTNSNGRVDFVLHRPSGRPSSFQALLQPFSPVYIKADLRSSRSLQLLSSASCDVPMTGMLSSPAKCATALFLSDVLFHLLREPLPDDNLFSFVWNSALWLNLASEGSTANFHIAFLVRLSVFLGLMPDIRQAGTGFYDLTLNEFTPFRNAGSDCLPASELPLARKIFRMNYSNMHLFSFTREQRNNLTDRILAYYKSHIPGFGSLKTLDVLHQLCG